MKKFILIVLFLCLAAGVVVYFAKPKAFKVDKEIKPFYTSIVTSFRATGAVSPRNRLEIRPAFAGRIEEILVNEGDEVKKGQVIVWMSSNERAAMIDAAMAQGEKEYKKWLAIYQPTPIMAPMNGFIILRNNEPGQTVAATDAIVVMADDLIIESDIDETDLRYITIGKKLEMYLDAYPAQWFTGTVEHIAFESQLINNVTVYKIKIKPDTKPAIFRAGMTATITVEIENKQNILALPSAFITERRGKKIVNIKTTKGFAEREIETGISDGRNVEIISSVTELDTAVTFSKAAAAKKKSALTGR
jgi:macrolide-specific efflux system membrane fusion protein